MGIGRTLLFGTWMALAAYASSASAVEPERPGMVRPGLIAEQGIKGEKVATGVDALIGKFMENVCSDWLEHIVLYTPENGGMEDITTESTRIMAKQNKNMALEILMSYKKVYHSHCHLRKRKYIIQHADSSGVASLRPEDLESAGSRMLLNIPSGSLELKFDMGTWSSGS